jgi:hypothetical protein
MAQGSICIICIKEASVSSKHLYQPSEQVIFSVSEPPARSSIFWRAIASLNMIANNSVQSGFFRCQHYSQDKPVIA